MGSEHLSASAIEAWHVGEGGPEAARHLSECGACSGYAQLLDEERAAFLAERENPQQAARRLLELADARRRARRSRLRLWVSGGTLAAAAAAAVLVVVATRSEPAADPIPSPPRRVAVLVTPEPDARDVVDPDVASTPVGPDSGLAARPDAVVEAPDAFRQLAIEVTHALKDRDFERYRALLVNERDLQRACPGNWHDPEQRAEMRRHLRLLHADAENHFEHCSRLVDWAGFLELGQPTTASDEDTYVIDSFGGLCLPPAQEQTEPPNLPMYGAVPPRELGHRPLLVELPGERGTRAMLTLGTAARRRAPGGLHLAAGPRLLLAGMKPHFRFGEGRQLALKTSAGCPEPVVVDTVERHRARVMGCYASILLEAQIRLEPDHWEWIRGAGRVTRRRQGRLSAAWTIDASGVPRDVSVKVGFSDDLARCTKRVVGSITFPAAARDCRVEWILYLKHGQLEVWW